MVQVKKPETRQGILDAAFQLFSSAGYAPTTIAQIAANGYRPALLQWIEQRVASMLSECLPADRRDYLEQTRTAHVLMMAFDGFVIGHHLQPRARFDDEMIVQFAALLLAGAGVRAATGSMAGNPQDGKAA